MTERAPLSEKERKRLRRIVSEGRGIARDAVEQSATNELEAQRQGREYWDLFDRDLRKGALRILKEVSPEMHADLRRRTKEMTQRGETPFFVDLAGAAASGIRGVETISNTLVGKGLRPRTGQTIRSGDLLLAGVRRGVFDAIDSSGKKLIFVCCTPGGPSFRHRNNEFIHIHFMTLVRGLYDRLASGGVMLFELWIEDGELNKFAASLRRFGPPAPVVRHEGSMFGLQKPE